MAKIIDVKISSENLNLKSRQLSVPLEDEKCIILELCDICQFCDGIEEKFQCGEEDFASKYEQFSLDEAMEALNVSSKSLLASLSQVTCVGCRRSCERLVNILRDTGGLSLDPLIISKSGSLTFCKTQSQCDTFSNLFTQHRTPLSEILDSIPKYKKSGRCMLHSMEGVRYRASSHIWFEVWEGLSAKCRDALSVIRCDKMVVALDNYLLKHRFCHECKNKVHGAYDILVGNRKVDPAKEKGYAAALYNGISKCSKGHIHVKSETDFIMGLITKAEPEEEGRRERHAKTLEIAQEEVLTCIGHFLYERLHRVYSSMKEEAQAFHILFHVGLDAIRRNFELALEKKQGFSKLEKLCEELQMEERNQKSKKEKKKKNKKKTTDAKVKKSTEKENVPTSDSEETSSPSKFVNSPKFQERSSVFMEIASLEGDVSDDDDDCEDDWQVVGRKPNLAPQRKSVKSSLQNSNVSHSSPSIHRTRDSELLKESDSVDSLTSRCSQCSRDGGYCSAPCSNSSSCNSSDVACGDAFCSHSDDFESPQEEVPTESKCPDKNCDKNCSSSFLHCRTVPCLSLEQMLRDFSCDTEEIPEAEVKAWHARLGSVKQMRAELRQKLRQQFLQLCHRKV